MGSQDHMVTLFLVFKEPPRCCPLWLLPGVTFPPVSSEGGFFHTSIYLEAFDDGHSGWCESCLIAVFMCVSLGIGDVDHFFVCLLCICVSSLERCLFRSSGQVLIGLFVFLIVSCLCILKINLLLVPNIFSLSIGCLFILFMVLLWKSL